MTGLLTVDSTHDNGWMTLRAMQVIDKKLKTSSPAVKSISAFSVYEVCIHNNIFFIVTQLTSF